MSSTGTRRARAVWGDGFENDGWDEIVRVKDWGCCSSDEFVRVFPRLIPSDGRLPDTLLRHLTTCVAVRAWRVQQIAARKLTQDWSARSITATDVETIGRQCHWDWFRLAPVPRSWRRFARNFTVSDHDRWREEEALAFVDSILWDSRNGTLGSFQERRATYVAFFTGIHPVYLWPEAMLSHELFTAVGWLGHLSRGRQALMPADIAQYFLEVIEGGDTRHLNLLDCRLEDFLQGTAAMAEVWRVAATRKRGRSVAARWPTSFRSPQIRGELPRWDVGLSS
jgi:hypothetical protein